MLQRKDNGRVVAPRAAGSDGDLRAGQLDPELGFPRGCSFRLSGLRQAVAGVSVYDADNKTRRHLNLFEYRTLIHARLPASDRRWRRPEPAPAAG